jgi:hypothetical protein
VQVEGLRDVPHNITHVCTMRNVDVSVPPDVDIIFRNLISKLGFRVITSNSSP